MLGYSRRNSARASACSSEPSWSVAGAEVRLTPLQGFRLGYFFQNRTRGNRQQGFDLSYFYRF